MSETPSAYNAKIIDEFRASEGRVGGQWQDVPLLLLHHTGAKTGAERLTPVAYLPGHEPYLVWAANGGAPKHPAWYHNLKAHPRTTIEVGAETIEVVAEEATGDERERLFARATQRYPQLAEAAGKTDRVIPMLLLRPVSPTDTHPTEPNGADMSTEHTPQPRTGVDVAPIPPIVDRATFQAQLDALRVREKAHTRAGDAIAAARRRLPMVEVDAGSELIGPDGPLTLLDAFEGRSQLLAYFHMWYTGEPAPGQCEGCTFFDGQVRELSYLHNRDITYAALCQGPYEESVRYRDFMGWTMPWYSSEPSVEQLLMGRAVGKFHLVSYLRDGDRVFETYWTNGRGAEAMDNIPSLADLTPYGRRETWEDSPAGWPQGSIMDNFRRDGRPIAQWSRLEAGRSDDLGTGPGTGDRGECCQ